MTPIHSSGSRSARKTGRRGPQGLFQGYRYQYLSSQLPLYRQSIARKSTKLFWQTLYSGYWQRVEWRRPLSEETDKYQFEHASIVDDTQSLSVDERRLKYEVTKMINLVSAKYICIADLTLSFQKKMKHWVQNHSRPYNSRKSTKPTNPSHCQNIASNAEDVLDDESEVDQLISDGDNDIDQSPLRLPAALNIENVNITGNNPQVTVGGAFSDGDGHDIEQLLATAASLLNVCVEIIR
jgi:hypothetical protein